MQGGAPGLGESIMKVANFRNVALLSAIVAIPLILAMGFVTDR